MVRVYERADSTSWYAEITVDGRAKRVSTSVPRGGRNKKKAEAAAFELQTTLNARVKAGLSFEEAVVRFLYESPLRQNSLRLYEIQFVRILRRHPGLHLGEITPTFLKSLLVACKDEGVGLPSIRVTIGALSSLMELAIEDEWPGAPKVNPCKLVSQKKFRDVEVKPRRWLEPEIVQKILDAATQPFWKPFLTLILETGMRHEEALGLKWSEIDLKEGVIVLPPARTKNGKGRSIPLTSTAFNTVMAVRSSIGGTYVFVNPATGKRFSNVGQGWRKFAQVVGCPGVRIHDLRHTFASWTRQSGLSKDDRRDIMGHTSEAAHDHYAKSRVSLLREQLETHSPNTVLAQHRLREETKRLAEAGNVRVSSEIDQIDSAHN